MYIYMYKGSAWVPAYAGIHASGSTSICSIQYWVE